MEGSRAANAVMGDEVRALACGFPINSPYEVSRAQQHQVTCLNGRAPLCDACFADRFLLRSAQLCMIWDACLLSRLCQTAMSYPGFGLELVGRLVGVLVLLTTCLGISLGMIVAFFGSARTRHDE